METPLPTESGPVVPAEPAGSTRPPKSALWEIIETLLITLVVALLLRQFVLQVNQIQGSSMEPTLYTNERVVTLKALYYFRTPHRGEVVVLANPYRDQGGKDDFIKRVIGVGGDTVEMRGGELFVNGQPLTEPYVHRSGDSFPQKTVPAGSVFVMGDNRPHSVDSRYFGFVKNKDVDGRAVLLFWPFNEFKPL